MLCSFCSVVLTSHYGDVGVYLLFTINLFCNIWFCWLVICICLCSISRKTKLIPNSVVLLVTAANQSIILPKGYCSLRIKLGIHMQFFLFSFNQQVGWKKHDRSLHQHKRCWFRDLPCCAIVFWQSEHTDQCCSYWLRALIECWFSSIIVQQKLVFRLTSTEPAKFRYVCTRL